MAKTTKVRFEVTLEVDIEAWNLDYGTETVREVQRDVKEYLINMLNGADGGLENLTVVSHG